MNLNDKITVKFFKFNPWTCQQTVKLRLMFSYKGGNLNIL